MEKQWEKVLEDGTEVIRTCAWSPPGCHPVGCGLRLYVKDGRLIKVEGDPEHPITKGRLCVRCLALKEYIYHPDRILYPLKRTGARGENKWERITWEEALTTIREKLGEIIGKYGPESMINFGGTGREAAKYAQAVGTAALGTPNSAYTQSGWSCYGPRTAIASLLFGTGFPEIDWAGAFPDRYDNPNYELPKYILLWGKEPLKSNPDGFFGHSVIDMMKRGTKIIMADPRMNWLATKSEHVMRLRPGTDTALAMALLNVVIREDLYDHDFVDKWVYGWEEFKERIMTMPPEKAEEITWVPAEKIYEVARILGTQKPTALGWGLAVDQSHNGVQLGHCLLALSAITGNLDAPGGIVLGTPIQGLMGASDNDLVTPELNEKCIGLQDYPLVNAILGTAHPDILLEQVETGKPYPVKFGFFMSTNLISPTNSAQPKRWHAALKKLDFAVATDVFLTPTIQAFADIVLPLSTFAEHDGIVLTHYGMNLAFIGAINKAINVGDCKSDLEIMLELRRILHPEKQTPADAQAYLDNSLEGIGLSFQELRNLGVWQPGDQEYRKYEKGLLRPDGEPGFSTPTGKVELYATLFEMNGEDPLPYYEEPRWSQNSKPEYAKDYPLIMTTGSRYYTSFHSEHRQIRSLREITPDPFVEIHPATAAEYGIKEGDWVTIENMFGEARLKAKITPIIHPKVINAAHGWWFPEESGAEPNLYGVWKSNVNNLIPHKEIGKLGFGAPYKSMMCKISKVRD